MSDLFCYCLSSSFEVHCVLFQYSYCSTYQQLCSLGAFWSSYLVQVSVPFVLILYCFTACSDIILLRPFEQWMHSLIFCKVSSHYRCLAYLFADVLNGLLCKERWKGNMPRVHCYCFMRSNETQADIMKV